jgi:hypothetical protein
MKTKAERIAEQQAVWTAEAQARQAESLASFERRQVEKAEKTPEAIARKAVQAVLRELAAAKEITRERREANRRAGTLDEAIKEAAGKNWPDGIPGGLDPRDRNAAINDEIADRFPIPKTPDEKVARKMAIRRALKE